MLGVVLLASAIPSAEADANDARLTWATATAATELMARERDIEARLLGVAADPAIGRLLDGVSGQSERQAADRLVTALRGADGSVVRGVCLATDDGDVTRIGGVASDSSGAGCASRSLATRALSLQPGGVARTTVPSADGSRRLLLATELSSGSRRESGVLAVEVGLRELFETTPSTVAGASAALLVDAQTSEIVAESGRATVESGDGTPGSRPLGNLRIRVDGILASHPGTTRDLEAAGWVATAAPLWRATDGAHFGFVQLWPAPVPASQIALVVAIAAFAIGVLVVAVVVARTFLRPFDSLAESQAQLEVLYREAREDSLHDGLTGLGNHRSFQEELDRQLAYGRRYGTGCAVFVIDLDNVKRVNDSLGHRAGDALIAGMGHLLSERLRNTDTLARLGGDEFAVLAPESESADVEFVAEKIVQAVREARFSIDGTPVRSTASVGFTEFGPSDRIDGGQLLEAADLAMYKAKDAGGDCWARLPATEANLPRPADAR
jgi:diguanylate cyclase (GGDEF)-like protein